MSEMRGLGKGIRALIPESGPLTQQEIQKIPLQSIRLNRFQPRKALNESSIHELANSIRESGLIYPLLVRKSHDSGVDEPKYELIAGERRFRALKSLGETEAPAIIREVGDRDALQLALVENLQREDLNPIEQAKAYQRLQEEFGLTQEQVASAVGKDRATVANTLRLLKLPEKVQEMVAAGRLSWGHARALLALESQRTQLQLAERAIANGLSVRQIEQIVRQTSAGEERSRRPKAKDPHLAAAEQKLERSLGTRVRIFHGRTRGWIRVAYFSLKDLDRLIARLT